MASNFTFSSSSSSSDFGNHRSNTGWQWGDPSTTGWWNFPASFSETQKNIAKLFLIASALALGIAVIVVFAQGQDVRVSGPCPTISAAAFNNMKPYVVSLPANYFLTFRTPAQVTSEDGTPLANGLSVSLENRCFNMMLGSSKLYVNDKLAAYSTVDGTMYDCTGKRIAYTGSGWNSYDLFDDAGQKIWTRTHAMAGKAGAITAQPSNVAVATLEYKLPSSTKGRPYGGYAVTVSDASSVAADPRFVLLTLSKIVQSRDKFDGCNEFVLTGGIITLIIVSIPFLLILSQLITRWYSRKRRMPAFGSSSYSL